MYLIGQIFFIFISALAVSTKETPKNNLRTIPISKDGSWQSFPTSGPKPVKSNPNVKCSIQTFGRCNSGEYCKSISYDKYQCTKCPKNNTCTGDGKNRPPLKR